MDNKIIRERFYKWLEIELKRAEEQVEILEKEPMMEHALSYEVGVVDTLRGIIIKLAIIGEIKPWKENGGNP